MFIPHSLCLRAHSRSSSLLSRLQSHALVRRHYNLVVALPYASASANELDFWNAVRHAMRSALPAAAIDAPAAATATSTTGLAAESAAHAQAAWTASERAALSGAAGDEERALLRYPSLAVARADVRCVCVIIDLRVHFKSVIVPTAHSLMFSDVL